VLVQFRTVVSAVHTVELVVLCTAVVQVAGTAVAVVAVE
jgi:hypothetical protein